MQKAYQKLFKLGLMKTESLHFFSALNFALFTYLSAIGNFWKKCFKISIYYQQEAMANFVSPDKKFGIFRQTAYSGKKRTFLKHSLSPNFKLISWAERSQLKHNVALNNIIRHPASRQGAVCQLWNSQ